jgi:hypothetical protein
MQINGSTSQDTSIALFPVSSANHVLAILFDKNKEYVSVLLSENVVDFPLPIRKQTSSWSATYPIKLTYFVVCQLPFFFSAPNFECPPVPPFGCDQEIVFFFQPLKIFV